MGLDQYVFRISKPQLEEREYISDELSGYTRVSAKDFETNVGLYKAIKPYAVKRDVICELYDTEKMIADYNLPKDSYIYMYSPNGIRIGGQDISSEEVDRKYTKTEVVSHYIWIEKEEAYWRKNYELADWMSQNIKGGTENCGYYRLNKTLINRLNSKFKANVPAESATEECALFYWEWY